jgi:hypothetical protein
MQHDLNGYFYLQNILGNISQEKIVTIIYIYRVRSILKNPKLMTVTYDM